MAVAGSKLYGLFFGDKNKVVRKNVLTGVFYQMIFIRGQKGVSRRGVFFIPELSFHMEGKFGGSQLRDRTLSKS